MRTSAAGPAASSECVGLILAVLGGTCLLWDQPRGSGNVEDGLSLGIELQGRTSACGVTQPSLQFTPPESSAQLSRGAGALMRRQPCTQPARHQREDAGQGHLGGRAAGSSSQGFLGPQAVPVSQLCGRRETPGSVPGVLCVCVVGGRKGLGGQHCRPLGTAWSSSWFSGNFCLSEWAEVFVLPGRPSQLQSQVAGAWWLLLISFCDGFFLILFFKNLFLALLGLGC